MDIGMIFKKDKLITEQMKVFIQFVLDNKDNVKELYIRRSVAVMHSTFLFEGRQRTVHVTQTGHMPAVLVLSGGKECICSSITVYALDGMFYAYK